MTADARVELVLVGRDEASSAVRALTESMSRLTTQAKALNKLFNSGFGTALSRQLDDLANRTKTLGAGMSTAADQARKALDGETAAAKQLADALRDVARAQDAVARAGRGRAGGNSGSGRGSGAGGGNAPPRGRPPASDTLRDVRARWQIRERSQAAELRHLGAVRREREAIERSVMRSGRDVYRYGRHALNSVNHPVLQSPGFWLQAGAVFGAEAGRHLLNAARSIDSATTRYSMMPGITAADTAAVRANALREGMRIGLDPAEVVRLQLQGIKDGLSKEISASLPAVVNAAVQTMGGSVDRDGDELAKAVREAFTVGWVKDAPGARSLMNQVAGLSTFNGNSPEKMQQFLASGGIGRGKELGWSLQQTLAFGAALNGAGERTGLGSARLMAQLPEIRAQMRDRYIAATRSHDNSEEHRATRAAPRLMGYGNVAEMQQAFATPEGVTDFLSRLSKLPEQTRAAIEKGYGLGPQFNAVAAEMGADHGARYHQAFKREAELSSQTAGNDDLARNGKIWSGSIDFMIGQLKASVEAIQSELGDVIKDDILTPFTKWWVSISEALLNGGLKADFHRAIQAFVEGFGFKDVAAALDALRGSVGTFDFPGFMRGIGEGARAFMDEIRSLASAFGGAGGLDARTVGRMAAELFGFSVALHVMAPVVTLIGGIASGFLAIKAALEFGGWVSDLTGLSSALRTFAATEIGGIASGLIRFAGAIGAIGAAVQILMDLGVLNKVTLLPKSTSKGDVDSWLWGKNKDGSSARPAWVDRLFGDGSSANGSDGAGLVKGPHGGLMKKQSYEGGANWRDLPTPAAYTTDTSQGDRDRTTAAAIGTQRAAERIADALDALVPKLSLTTSSSSLSGVAGSGGGGGEGGGNANLRYGRGAAGGYRSTPGTGSYGNPSKSLLDLIAQSEGAGYNVSWGNGRFLPGGKEQNLTGKSLNEILALGDHMRRQPGARNSSALGRYQITGSTLRDLMGRLHLSGNEKFDEAMQDRLASKLIADEGPRALQRWEGLKRGTYMSRAQALLRSGSIASQPGAASFNGGGAGSAGKAVDIAMSMQGAGERSAQSILGAYMHPGEWCADFVNGTLKKAGITGSGSAMASSFSRWGQHVDHSAVQKGDVITERHGGHVGHVGLATGNVQRDKAGNVTAVEMVSGNYGHQVRKNWEKVGIIDDLRRAVPTPESLAGAVHGHGTGSVPERHHTPARQPAMSSADNSMVIHNTFHLHGTDPKHQADHILARLEQQKRSRYIDSSSG